MRDKKQDGIKEPLPCPVEICKKQELFHGIDPEKLPTVLKCLGSYSREYQKGEFIILQEEDVKCIGIVLSGRVQMIHEDSWGNKAVLTTIKESGLFGETFVCGSTLEATVSFLAKESCRVLFLPFSKVMHCNLSCNFHHRLIENMVVLIANKNVQLMEKLEIVSQKTIREKIMAFLTSQAQANHSKYFTINMGRMEMAEYLSVDRSALTRELNSMKEEGLLDFEKNTFKL